MVLVRRGVDPFARLREQFDRQLADVYQWLPGVTTRPFAGRHYPVVNIWDEGSELIAEAELPGLKSENLEITVVGSELTIKGERPSTAAEGEAFHRRERSTGPFTRVLRLPVEVEADRVQAALRDGVLSIRLPKHEAAKPRKIAVKAK